MSENTAPTATDQALELQDGLKIWSCVHCRRRKLRCERRQPCANCVRSNIDCHFPVTGRLPRRSRDTAGVATTTSPSQKQAELMGRLRRLEAVVTELTAQIEDGASAGAGESSTTSATHHDASAIWQKHNDPSEDFGDLVADADGSVRVAKGFWSIFCSEVDNIFQAVADVANATEEQTHADTSDDGSNVPGSIRSHHQALVLGTNLTPSSDDVDLSPLPSQMLFIWQVFCHNVDPFIKVLDIPTTTQTMQGIKGKLHTLVTETEALAFSVSLAAIVSLDEEEVELNFGLPKPRLLARFRLGTERALARAEFMTTRSLTVAQAFVVYVTLLPQLGASQLAAPMTAVLVRLALSMRLHRDLSMETDKQSTTLEEHVETRNRLWWHICFLDARVRHTDVPELSISQSTATTKEPSNTNDNLVNSQQFTNVTLCLIRCELGRLSHNLRDAAKDTLGSQQRLLSYARTDIQQKYFADENILSNSLKSFTYHLTQLLFSQIDYTICRRRVHNEDQVARAFHMATTLMETVVTLKTRTEWKCWHWQLQGHAPWSAMLFTLQNLSQGPWGSQADQAWAALQQVVDTLPEETKELRVMKVVNSRIEDIRRSKQQQTPGRTMTSDTQHLASQSPQQADQMSAQPQVTPDYSGGTSAFEVGDVPQALQESWDLFDVGEDATFQWGPMLETEDAMQWQLSDENLEMSLFWDLNTF